MMIEDGVTHMDMMIILFLLVLINLLIAIGRQSTKKWVRMVMTSLAFLLFLICLAFGFRMLT